MNIKQVCSLLVVVFFLAACSSNSAPALNVDNDVWSGTLTDAQNVADGVRFVFKQTGTEIEAALTIIRGTQTRECCALKGSLSDKKLAANFVNEANDFSATVSGDFSEDGKSLTGTLRFVIEGATQDYALQMSYQSEQNVALVASFASKSTIESVQGLLE
jgi:hypothetical protein